MKPLTAPVFAQVAALVLASIVASQAISFLVVVAAPPPEPPGFSVADAAAALKGEPARDRGGRRLSRTLADATPIPAADDPLEALIAASLAESLGAPPGAVRVELLQPARAPRAPRRIILGRKSADDEVVVLHQRIERRLEPHGSAQVAIPRAPAQVRMLVTGDRVSFPAFAAAWRQPDGRWAQVAPPRSLLSPWQARVLLGFGLSVLLLAPLAWLLARRLTRPITVFAEAAERLGADPLAPPLAVAGPAEVRNAAAAFNDMQHKLRRYVEGRSQMVAAIAHDLRTPLTRLRFRAEQAPPELGRRMAEDIDQMDGMIRSVLGFVRGESVREPRTRLDLGALASSVAHDFAEQGAEVEVEAPAGLEVEGEPLNLRRMLCNLVENALKFGRRARVQVRRETDRAVIVVNDDGPGLPPDELERVFDPFHRVERSRNRDTGGVGLGLAAARTVARAHGGDIVLANRPEGGLSARLELPL